MLYTYEAFNKDGQPVKGEVEAASEKDVVIHLEGKELIPSKIRGQEKTKGFLNKLSGDVFARVRDVDRIFMVRNLATALRAGLSIAEALTILINDTKPGPLRDILVTAKSTVQAGRPLSEALSIHSKHFPPVFLGLLKAGEVSSQLDKALDELAQYLAREYALVKRIKSALSYPIMLLIGSFMVVIFLLTFVLPRLAKTFALSGAELPLITKVLLSSSSFVNNNALWLFPVVAAAVTGFILAIRTTRGKEIYHGVVFNIPVVRDLVRGVALVRFTRTLQSLFAGTTPILKALEVSAEAVGNETYKKAIEDIEGNMRVGVPLSRSLEKYPKLFPALLTSLIAVGEKTGNLEYVLRTFSTFYDEEVEMKLKDLTGLFEPILLITMGLIVGTIAVSVLLPIYQLVGSFT